MRSSPGALLLHASEKCGELPWSIQTTFAEGKPFSTAFSPQHVVLARPAARGRSDVAAVPLFATGWHVISEVPEGADGQRLRGWVLGSDSKKSLAFAA